MTPSLIILLLCLWLALIVLARVLLAGPRHDPHDLIDATILLFLRVYLRLVHRQRFEGLQHIRQIESVAGTRPVIVVANHTAGIDPLLVQNATWSFEIRWMMASDMRVPILEPFWNWSRIIDVERYGNDSASVRTALRHLAGGGVVGIFPEGGIERPRESILPFLPGVGLLIRKSKAIVLPAVIDGTPQVDPAFASLWHASRSRVRFFPPIDYTQTDLKPAQIAQDLQQRYLDWTGWPLNEHRTDGVGASNADRAVSQPA